MSILYPVAFERSAKRKKVCWLVKRIMMKIKERLRATNFNEGLIENCS